jgi:hypothetical protein
MVTELTLLRMAYADYLVRCADTVAVLTPDEVKKLRAQAVAGMYDNDENFEEIALAENERQGWSNIR